MKSILLTGIAVVMMAIATFAFADKDHHKDGDSPQLKSGMAHSGSEMTMKGMESMHEHMAQMQKTMDKIHNSKDGKKRQELMQQHMQEMHKGMGMMQGMKGSMGMMNKKGEKPDMKAMMNHSMMTEQRMDMMQEMMGQMMEHMKVQQGMSTEKN